MQTLLFFLVRIEVYVVVEVKKIAPDEVVRFHIRLITVRVRVRVGHAASSSRLTTSIGVTISKNVGIPIGHKDRKAVHSGYHRSVDQSRRL